MRFSEHISVDTILPNMAAKNKADAIHEMAEALFVSNHVKSAAVVEKALIDREKLGSTGIGNHVAIPHAKYDDTDKIVALYGKSSDGVEFDALDGKKTHFFFLLLAPSGEPGRHLKLLARISRLVRLDGFCDKLKKLETPEEILKSIEQAEQSL